MAKAQDLRQKNLVELNEELTALLKQQFALRMKKAMQSLENPCQIKMVRKDIARVKTIMTQMQATAANEAKGAC